MKEADGRLILHAADASVHGEVVDIFTQDTDVLMLAVRHIPKLCKNTNCRTGTRAKKKDKQAQLRAATDRPVA